MGQSPPHVGHAIHCVRPSVAMGRYWPAFGKSLLGCGLSSPVCQQEEPNGLTLGVGVGVGVLMLLGCRRWLWCSVDRQEPRFPPQPVDAGCFRRFLMLDYH